MDLLSLFIGLLIGAAVAGFIGWKIGTSKAQSHSQQLSLAEEEIKQLISKQAQQHIDTTKSAVDNMQEQLKAIQEQLAGFESGLRTEKTVNTDDTFYGEHASLFLRNTQGLKAKKHQPSAADNQPRDFSSGSSGVFVGESEETKEKGNG